MSNTNCFDFDLSQIARLDAYKVSDVNAGVPVYASFITRVTPQLPANPGYDPHIPFEKESVSISDSESKSVGGVLHTVKVSWEMKLRTYDEESLLSRLRNTPHCLLVKCFGNISRLILTGVSGYDFTAEESDGKLKCTMVLRNGMGICKVA
jgi:hypothetical protein